MSTIAKSITVFNDFLSVPNIMGTGPIIMTPPPLTLPLPLPADLLEINRIASIIMKTPMIINTMPVDWRNSMTANFFFSPKTN